MKLVILGGATFVAALALSTAASAGECRDPWVTKAITEHTGHAPRGAYESLDCNYKLYGGGSWGDYSDLLRKVKASYRDPQPPAAVTLTPPPSGLSGNGGAKIVGGSTPGIAGAARPAVTTGSAAGLIGMDGSTLNAKSASSMVAAGGGN